MHPIIENILERPRTHKIGIWVVTIIFLGFIFWQYFYKGSSEELAKLVEKRESVNGQIISETRVVNNLEKYRREVSALNAQFESALKRLPQSREIPNLLESVSTLAKDSGLDVRRFAPKPDVLKEYYAEVPVDVEMRGTFHKVATFFDEISKLSRIVNVQDIKIGNARGYSEEAGVEVDVKGVINTFRYLEPSERIQVAADADGKTEKGKRKAPGATPPAGAAPPAPGQKPKV